MLKKTMTYEDCEGNNVTEDFWFNLTQAEIVKLNYSCPGGLEAYTKKCIKDNNYEAILELFETIISMSYGEKSPDGKRFVKTKELTEAFMQTEAYSNLFIELVTNPDAGQTFIKGVTPKGAVAAARNKLPINN